MSHEKKTSFNVLHEKVSGIGRKKGLSLEVRNFQAFVKMREGEK